VGYAQTTTVLNESMLGGMGDLKLWKTRCFWWWRGWNIIGHVFWRVPEWLSMVGGMGDC